MASSRPNRLAVLDGVRAVAVLVVLAYHLGYAAGWEPQHALPRAVFAASGTIAVQAFFVLSGFLLFLPTARTGVFWSLPRYALRRVARILPAYVLCLVLVVALRPLLLPRGAVPAPEAGSVLAHLTFTEQELLPRVERGFGGDAAVWTLSIEAQFYVLLPFAAVAFARRPAAWLTLALVVSVAWVPLAGSSGRNQFPEFAACFASGMAAAWLFTRVDRVRMPPPARLLGIALAAAAGVIACAAAIGRGERGGHVDEPASTAAAIPLLLGIICLLLPLLPERACRPLTNRPVSWIARVSYSIYLLQLLPMHFARQTLHLPANGSPRSVMLMAAFAAPVTLLAAGASYALVEAPFQRWARGGAPPEGASPGHASSVVGADRRR